MLHRRNRANSLSSFLLAGALVLGSVSAARAGGDWNDSAVDWKRYDDGLAEAAKSGKPVCLIFYTDWCPHCTKYSAVFHDDRVIAKAKSFVMIRLNKDKNAELSGSYAPDGEYIPRTFFLGSNGKVNDSIKAPRDKFQFFYNPESPAELLAGMDRALGKS